MRKASLETIRRLRAEKRKKELNSIRYRWTHGIDGVGRDEREEGYRDSDSTR